ncbi:MAG: lipopolysaccharide biosynthesis protein [Erysipelotrichaceae bacterium]|nr:lipopolysaccharide biosynthesis protein [Erysipelotrichaceae bacterium]
MNKTKKGYSVLKAISWYAVGNVFVKSISFFVLPLFSNLMSTADYGVYTIFTSNAALIDSIIIFGLAPTIRMAKYDNDTDYELYTSTIVVIPILLVLLLALVSNVYMLFNPVLMSLNRTVWNWMLFYCATNVICIILSNRFVLDGRYKAYFIYLLINTLIAIGSFLLLAKFVFLENTYMARIVGQSAGNFLSILFFVCTIGYKGISPGYLKKGVVWGAPLVIHSFMISLFGQMDTQLINVFSEFSELGVYGMATTLGLVPATLEATFESAWSPWFFNKMNVGDTEKIRETNNTYFTIFAVILGEFMLILPELVRFLNRSYWDCVFYLLPITINSFIELIYLVPLNIQYYYKNTKNIMFATVIATLLDALMVVLFIQLYGFYGAVYAKTISKIALVAIHDYSAKKLDQNNYFSSKLFVLLLLILFAIDAIVVLFTDFAALRLFLFAAIGIVALTFTIRKRKELLQMFNGG